MNDKVEHDLGASYILKVFETDRNVPLQSLNDDPEQSKYSDSENVEIIQTGEVAANPDQVYEEAKNCSLELIIEAHRILNGVTKLHVTAIDTWVPWQEVAREER